MMNPYYISATITKDPLCIPFTFNIWAYILPSLIHSPSI